MLPTQLLWLCNPVTHAFQIPALCQVRKGRGTHYVFCASEARDLGYQPAALSVESPPFRKRSVGHLPGLNEVARLKALRQAS